MRKEKIRVSVWGFGAMGSGIVEALLTKQGVEIASVCDLHPEKVGKSIFDLLNVKRTQQDDVKVSNNIDEALSAGKIDVCLLCTDSFTAKAFPKMKKIIEKGINVISTAEQMSYPSAQEPEITKELNALAKKHKVTVLGTGINPGLIMDLLVLTISGAMTDVKHIEAKRVNSLSPFGPTVMEEQGIGITVEEFEEGKRTGHLAGHVGFHESVQMIADGMALNLTKFEQDMKPIVTSVDRKSKYGFAKAGTLAGVNMTGVGYVDGKPMIDMIHPQQIEPEMEGTHTGDYVTITGTPNVSLAIKPEVDGGIGTIAMVINMIPHVINARPGVKTAIDLPVPRAIMGDFRKLLEDCCDDEESCTC